jgi:hypothetical protein
MHHLNHVKKWARILEWATIIGLVTIPIAIIGALFSTPITLDTVAQKLENIAVSPATTPLQVYVAVGLNLIPPIILLFTLNRMRQLFGSYRQGQILTDQSALLIQRIGQGFLSLAVVPFVLQPILSVVLSFANPSGERSVSINLNSEMFFFAAAGGLIIIIGWAMREASDMASENRAFV